MLEYSADSCGTLYKIAEHDRFIVFLSVSCFFTQTSDARYAECILVQ